MRSVSAHVSISHSRDPMTAPNGDSMDGFVFPPFIPSASRAPQSPPPAPAAAPAPAPERESLPWDSEPPVLNDTATPATEPATAEDEDLPWLDVAAAGDAVDAGAGNDHQPWSTQADESAARQPWSGSADEDAAAQGWSSGPSAEPAADLPWTGAPADGASDLPWNAAAPDASTAGAAWSASGQPADDAPWALSDDNASDAPWAQSEDVRSDAPSYAADQTSSDTPRTSFENAASDQAAAGSSTDDASPDAPWSPSENAVSDGPWSVADEAASDASLSAPENAGPAAQDKAPWGAADDVTSDAPWAAAGSTASDAPSTAADGATPDAPWASGTDQDAAVSGGSVQDTDDLPWMSAPAGDSVVDEPEYGVDAVSDARSFSGDGAADGGVAEEDALSPQPAAAQADDPFPDWLAWDARAEADASAESNAVPPLDGLDAFLSPGDADAADDAVWPVAQPTATAPESDEEFSFESLLEPAPVPQPTVEFAVAPEPAPADAGEQPVADPFTAAALTETEVLVPAADPFAADSGEFVAQAVESGAAVASSPAASGAGHPLQGAFEDAAARLEQIARTLRENPDQLIAGASGDPLALLVTGYVLGAAHGAQR